ncbi:retrovirus-related pol polyprotein from transposon TNT 1-94 [Tanacetum coccineum]
MTTLADKAILSGAENRPPMLEKDMYDSWKSRMELYMMNRQHGRMILESVKNGPLIWPTIEENGVTRPKKYSESSAMDAIQADCDIKATNIILQGLPPEVYALVSNHKVAKELWERIQLLMQGTSLTKQERECKLYDEFDKFAYKKGETLRDFYLRFSLLLNDMNIYNMKLEQFQVNTKFLNTLPPEWSKFVTDVKLVRDLHTTNIDQLHAYLGQHEFHANEVRLMHERNSDPLALSQQYLSNQSSTPLSITYPSNNYQSSVHHNAYSSPSSIPQIKYALIVNQQQQQPEFPSLDLGLTVLVFKQGDDPIDAINHMMSFLSAVVTSRYPTTNNQLRNSSNLRQQATINDGRITLQPDMTTKFGKLDKFEGSDFRRWQKKMQFLLTTLKVAYVLSTPRPEFVEEETLEQTRKRCKQVYESDKYILSSHGVFIGFGYYNNGMFMLNLNKVPSSINSVYMAYSHVVDSKLWHARLGYVHYQQSRDAILLRIGFSSIPRLKDIVYSSNGTQGGDLPGETPTAIPNLGEVKELGCKWIFKNKMKADGTIDKFKARLVIQGFRQKEGIDYFDTYAPVARISTIRLLIALAATHNLVIHQMDVKTAFLNGDLEEEIYMKQPEGFVMPDKCVYCKFDESGKGVIICLYVDDMLIFGGLILWNKKKRRNKGLAITQSHYIEKILKKFNYEGCGPVSTPMEAGIKLVPHMGKPINQLEYSRAIGCLMYAMTSIRPGYSDASWITNSEDHTSTTGWVFLLGGALAAAGKEAEWLRNLIYRFPLVA